MDGLEQTDDPAERTDTTDTADTDLYDDPDLAEYESAKRAAEEGEEAGQEPDPADDAEDAGDRGDPPSAQAGADTDTAPPMIPKARLDNVLNRARRAENQNLIYQGHIEALEAQIRQRLPQQQSDGTPASPGQPSLDQQIEQIDTERNRLYERFDNGDITSMADLRNQERALDKQRQHLERQFTETQQPPQPVRYAMADEREIVANANDVSAHHPYLNMIATDLPADQAQKAMTHLEKSARLQAQAVGEPIGSGPAETMRLHSIIGELSDIWGPRWFPGVSVQSPSTSTPSQPRPAGQQQDSLKARQIRHALDQAAQHPPDIGNIGSRDNPAMPSEEQIAGMSEDELLALPKNVRDRLLYGQP